MLCVCVCKKAKNQSAFITQHIEGQQLINIEEIKKAKQEIHIKSQKNLAELEKEQLQKIQRYDEIVGQINDDQSSTVYFPKIELSTSYQLPEILKSMGIQDVFTESADLSGISGNKSMKIDEAIHKAKLIVNEQGTEAAASTYIQIGVKSAGLSKTFRFDHPFLYFIRHQTTGQILFLGEIHNF